MNDDNNKNNMNNVFDNLIWPQLKSKAKELSKKELAREFFLAGYMLCEQHFEDMMQNIEEEAMNNPEEFEQIFTKMKKHRSQKEEKRE